MIGRPADVRKALARPDTQISESAIVQFSQVVNAYATKLVSEAHAILSERNKNRETQGLEPLRRLTDEHVVAAAQRCGNG